MNVADSISLGKCTSCGSINLESDVDMVKCLDCGMGKYKAGRHKGVR